MTFPGSSAPASSFAPDGAGALGSSAAGQGHKQALLARLWAERYRVSLPDSLASDLLASEPLAQASQAGEESAAKAVTEVLLTALRHRSVRHYAAAPLPKGALEAGIAAASSAPSSLNLQCWSVVAVEEAGRRAQLAELAGNQPYVAEVPLFLAWVLDLSRLERMAERAGQSSDALHHQESFLMAAFDTALAAQNASLTFESMGLGTVFIGGLRNEPEEVAKLLNLPPRAMAIVGMCVGVPAPEAGGAIKPRLPQEVILHREQYGTHSEPGHIAAYDERADAYQQEQGLPSRLWSQMVVSRIDQTGRLGSRARLRAVLERLGFGLK